MRTARLVALMCEQHEQTLRILNKLMRRTEHIMIDLQALKDAQATLAADIVALRSVGDGVVVVLDNQHAQLVDLAAQIAALTDSTDVQKDIDALVEQTKSLATQVEETSAEVTAAVTANTVAATEPAPVPVPETDPVPVPSE